jgi:hypothetical protein
MNNSEYKQTEIGWPIIILLLIVTSVLGLIGGLSRYHWITLVFIILFIILIILFGTITVIVQNNTLIVKFGIGIIRKSLSLDKVTFAKIVKYPWYYGWGIRMTFTGWLYRLSGTMTVEFYLKDGKTYAIGIKNPEKLLNLVVEKISPMTEPDPKRRKQRKKIGIVIIVTFIVTVFGFIAGLFIYSNQDPEITIDSKSIQISGMYGTDIESSSIKLITIETQLPKILLRTNGYAAFGVLKGHFDVEKIGEAVLFLMNKSVPPYIFIQTDQNTYIINYDTPEKTESLFDRLKK